MKPSLESILREAVSFKADALDGDQHISGADLVEWFAQWRRRAQAIVQFNPAARSAAIYCERFHSRITEALRALQIMQDRAEVEGPLMSELTHGGQYPTPTDAEIDELICALDNGGIQITCGPFKALVFKHSAEAPSCKRR